MEMNIIVAFLLAIIIMVLSIYILRKATFLPIPQLIKPKMPCPQVTVNLTPDNFNQHLTLAQSGCAFSAYLRFYPSDDVLEAEAEFLGLKDKSGKPVVLKTDSCDIPFPALVLCNGTLFPGDLVELSGKQAVIIRKLGR